MLTLKRVVVANLFIIVTKKTQEQLRGENVYSDLMVLHVQWMVNQLQVR